MPDKPERPYVPRPTPQASRKVVTKSEFAVSRPFVPGSDEALPAIVDFLDNTHGNIERVATETLAEFETYDPAMSDELPPVEHFIDPLPPVNAFAPEIAREGTDRFAEGDPAARGIGAFVDTEESGWIHDEWQRYDWGAAAALGDGPESEASNDWATTDWEVSPSIAREKRQNTAEAIASALDQIAQRIRQGELAVPAPGSLGDPAAIAASLAALLGVKR